MTDTTFLPKFDATLAGASGDHVSDKELANSFHRLYARTSHFAGRPAQIGIEDQALADRMVAGGVIADMFTVIG